MEELLYVMNAMPHAKKESLVVAMSVPPVQQIFCRQGCAAGDIYVDAK